MKRFMLPAGVALAGLVPGLAEAQPPSAAHARAYERAYHQAVKKLGGRAPGRNIVSDGVARGRAATDAEVLASLAVLERMLGAGVPTTATQPATLMPTTYSGSAGAGGVPACASESGTNYSTGPSNTNGSSGATGRYQILPSTAAAYGCNLSSPAGQDACAATIYAHQGGGAWVGCGG